MLEKAKHQLETQCLQLVFKEAIENLTQKMGATLENFNIIIEGLRRDYKIDIRAQHLAKLSPKVRSIILEDPYFSVPFIAAIVKKHSNKCPSMFANTLNSMASGLTDNDLAWAIMETNTATLNFLLDHLANILKITSMNRLPLEDATLHYQEQLSTGKTIIQTSQCLFSESDNVEANSNQAFKQLKST